MKRVLLALTAATLLGGSAFAADLPTKKSPPPAPAPAATPDGFDFAFGIKAMTNNMSRGISLTRNDPAVAGYGELRYNMGDTQFYFNTTVSNTKTPTDAWGEVDLMAGVRQTWGKFNVDVGGVFYLYPGNKSQYWTSGVPAINGLAFNAGVAPFTLLNPVGATAATCAGGFCASSPRDPSFLELFIKPTYNFTDSLSLGASVYWSPDWGHYSQNGGKGFSSTYLSVLPKYVFGESGFSVSGELGYQFLGSLKTGTIYNSIGVPFKYPSYWSWNAGVSYAWNNITLDLRYFGSTLNSTQCYVVSSDPAGNVAGLPFTGRSSLCGHKIAASVSFDLVASKDLKRLP